jgi:hypothetical protein
MAGGDYHVVGSCDVKNLVHLRQQLTAFIDYGNPRTASKTYRSAVRRAAATSGSVMQGIPSGGEKHFAADFCSNLYGKRV